jgi:hypothetical protein
MQKFRTVLRKVLTEMIDRKEEYTLTEGIAKLLEIKKTEKPKTKPTQKPKTKKESTPKSEE